MIPFYSRFRLSFLFLLVGFSTLAQNFTDGIFVLNEGGAGGTNASVSFLANTTVTNNIYATTNPTEANLGDTAQSMGYSGDYAYIVLNISNTIKVVNRVTFQYVATISTGLNNPRFIAFADGKAFVTNWGDAGSTTDDYVAVINLATNLVESTIAVAEGPERIQEIGGKLYVAQQGGYGFGNSVSVIDPVTSTVLQTIPVGDVPNSLLAKDGFLYVLCGGKPYWAPVETYGKLVKINLTDHTVSSTTDFTGQHPANLRIGAGVTVYYTIDEHVYQTDLTSGSFPATPFFSIPTQGSYGIYGMDVIDGKIYVADAMDYASAGKAYVYGTTGTLENTFTVGVIPNGFYKSADSSLGTIDHGTALQLTIAPNPASDVFYLNTDKAATVSVYDVAGRLVQHQLYTASGIDISRLTTGVYVVETTIETTQNVQRLVIR